jgi:hypothetical protein
MLGDGCIVCSAEKHPQADACPRCKHILGRVETRRNSSSALRHVDRQARLRALQESWHDGAFHCFYTDITLVDDGERSHDHRYLVFEHRTPGDEASVVVCALVNRPGVSETVSLGPEATPRSTAHRCGGRSCNCHGS